MSCFRTSPIGWFSAFSFSSLDSKSDDVGCVVYRNAKKKEGKKFPIKKMHPLSLFPLNWPFLNVINAIMDINLGIWGWTPGVYKAPEIICKFLRYFDFFEICWFFWNSFYQLLRGTLMTKMLGTTGFTRTRSRTLIKCGYYSM